MPRAKPNLMYRNDAHRELLRARESGVVSDAQAKQLATIADGVETQEDYAAFLDMLS